MCTYRVKEEEGKAVVQVNNLILYINGYLIKPFKVDTLILWSCDGNSHDYPWMTVHGSHVR